MAETLTDAAVRWLRGDPVPPRAEICAAFPYLKRRWPDFDNWERSYVERDRFISTFGFSVPCREALDLIVQHGPIVEVGAGTGAWAKLIQNRGAEVIATDTCTEHRADEPGRTHYGFDHGRWAKVIELGAAQAVETYQGTVFCSWPSLDSTWLKEAGEAMQPGRHLIVVREECTAGPETWDYIEGAFERVGGCALPTFPGIHDYLEVWRKEYD